MSGAQVHTTCGAYYLVPAAQREVDVMTTFTFDNVLDFAKLHKDSGHPRLVISYLDATNVCNFQCSTNNTYY